MAARKSARKKTTRKAAAPAAKKTTKAAPKKAAPKKTVPKKAAKKSTKKAGEVSPEGVNMAHVFALRPRVTTAFSQEMLRRAKEELREERYETVQDAARAVATKALELSQKKPGKHGVGRR